MAKDNHIPGALGGAAALLIAAAAREVWTKIDENLVNPKPDPAARANITLSEEEDRRQSGYLRQKGLLSNAERLIAFYNNAVVSPAFGDDRTNTCLFVTEKRVIQVKDSKLNCACDLTEVKAATVEHNSILSDDYVVLALKGGTTLKMEVVRESVGNTLVVLIKHLAKISP